MERIKKLSRCKNFRNFMFDFWDGLVFFGFDESKLNRLRGQRARWYDRLKNKKWVFNNIIIIIFFIYVIAVAINAIGTEKSQSINHEFAPKQKFEITEQLKLMGTVFFYWGELIAKVNKNQENHITHDYEHLTAGELKEVEDFICKNV